jgi:hypothetical protein
MIIPRLVIEVLPCPKRPAHPTPTSPNLNLTHPTLTKPNLAHPSVELCRRDC